MTGAFYSVAARLGTVAVRSEGPSTHYGSGVAASSTIPGLLSVYTPDARREASVHPS